MTIAELNQLTSLLSLSPVNLFTLGSDRIKPAKVWCYISFSKCSEKLQRGLSLLTCLACNNANIVGILSIRAPEAHMLARDGENPEESKIRCLLQTLLVRVNTFKIKVSNSNF
ncbi:hypothetical protein BRARA_B02330 [Brassica rapa]|uniref:Uncharacterized protein n=1 Tax=Brassica campestris TaxID=3711 RepID=A0A398ABY5_BRACM|nr:hypothetical protein BRARA_B02330 [Brassica rapa]